MADAITVPSTVARDSFVQMGVAAEKFMSSPTVCVSTSSGGLGAPPADSFEVLFAGQISLRKGIPYLLEAFARLRHPHKRLTLVGSVQDDIRQLLTRLPKEQCDVHRQRHSANRARGCRWRAATCATLASVEEGLALVQSQAMACGCPVIATTATGAENLFTDGVEGFIVPDRDTDALAARLQQLADDPALRERMSAAALERVKTLGGWDQYGEQWDTLLHELTGLPKNPD